VPACLFSRLPYRARFLRPGGPPHPRFTGVAAAIGIAIFGTTASALVAHRWEFVWIYYAGPLAGMLMAAAIFVRPRSSATRNLPEHDGKHHVHAAEEQPYRWG
jgi:TRAP-type C4-dicarboxylate transport system permease small subunit